MGERLLCKQEVIGSIPFTSTIGTSTTGEPQGRRAAGVARQRRKRVLTTGRQRWCGPATFGEARETPFWGDPDGVLVDRVKREL